MHTHKGLGFRDIHIKYIMELCSMDMENNNTNKL